MTSEEASQAFDEFYKADPARHDRSATGLGLCIARQIIRLHGGRIDLASTGPGLGTVARFQLEAIEKCVFPA